MPGPPEIEQKTGNGTIPQGGKPESSAKPAKPETKQPARSPNADRASPGSQLSPGCRDFVINNPERSSGQKGTAVHRAIREQLSTRFGRQGYGPHISVRLPDASFEPYRDKKGLGVGGAKRQGEGDVDLAFRGLDGKVMLLAEIKPANWDGILGATQLQNYIDKANSNEEIKRTYDVRVFSPMLPDRFNLPPLIYAEGKIFEIRWCGPGIILYKEVRKKQDDEKKKRQPYKEQVKEQRATSKEQEKVKEQRATSADARAIYRPMGIEILQSAPRPVLLPDWTPERLRRDIAAGTLRDGLYRDRYSAPWAYGANGNVVVWVKTGPLGKEHQYYQEWPTDPSFYEVFAKRRGLSNRQAELIRNTLTDYNRDLWSLIAPDPVTHEPSSRSPQYAREELRSIYEGLLKGIILGSAGIVGAGAGITTVTNAAAGRGTAQSSVTPDRKPIPSREEPLPDWVSNAVQKGAADFLQELEKQMRVTQ
jgi:hypothetical protein